MAGSFVVCNDCGDSSAAVEWGFVLLARHGWTAQLGEAGSEPSWRCPACNASARNQDTWDAEFAMNEPETPRRRLRVLLVDDQVLVLRATAGMLREVDVVTASSGAEALARLAEGGHFDVIVSDVAMPGINGAELYARVKASYPQLAERFLLLSGDSYGAAALCAVVARRDRLERMPPIIDKPVPRDMLVREIQALGHRSLPRSGTFAIGGDVAQLRETHRKAK
jgi:CheY-like chemotaxis protein